MVGQDAAHQLSAGVDEKVFRVVMEDLELSSVPRRLNIVQFRRNDLQLVLNCTSGGVAINFSGASLRFDIKKSLNDAASIVSYTLSDGITVSGGAVTITISRDDIMPLGIFSGFYEATYITSGGLYQTLAYGKYQTTEDVF